MNNYNEMTNEKINTVNEYVSSLKTKVTSDISSFDTKVTSDISSFETTVTSDISSFDTKVTSDISLLETKVTSDISSLDTKVTDNINKLNKLIKSIPALYKNSKWTQMGQDIDGETVGDNSGRSVSLSSDGSIVAIGALNNDDNGTNAGQVRVYKWNGSSWTQMGSDIDGEAAGDESGFSVSLSLDGSIVAVGAILGKYLDGTGFPVQSGIVKVYEFSSDWILKGSTILGETVNDKFGYSVSLSSNGNSVAIGVPYRISSPQGIVQVFVYNGNNWLLKGSTIVGDASGDEFGYSVSLSSDESTVAIGVPKNNNGKVKVYELSGNSWNQIGSDLNGDAVNDNFGWSVSLNKDGTIVAIGAPNPTSTGSVKIYKWDSITWTQIGSDLNGDAVNDTFGTSVSLSSDGSRVAIGAPAHDTNGSNSGQVKIINNETVRLLSSIP